MDEETVLNHKSMRTFCNSGVVTRNTDYNKWLTTEYFISVMYWCRMISSNASECVLYIVENIEHITNFWERGEF